MNFDTIDNNVVISTADVNEMKTIMEGLGIMQVQFTFKIYNKRYNFLLEKSDWQKLASTMSDWLGNLFLNLRKQYIKE